MPSHTFNGDSSSYWIHSFTAPCIHSFIYFIYFSNKHLLGAHHVADTIMGARNADMSKVKNTETKTSALRACAVQ